MPFLCAAGGLLPSAYRRLKVRTENRGGPRSARRDFSKLWLRLMSTSLAMTVRTASPADIPAIVQLVNAAYAIETFFGGTRTDAEEVADLMQKGVFLVAQSAAGPLLACVYTEVRGERGYFGMLSVEPSRQGSGLGRRMVEAAEELCRSHGCKYVDITVLSLRPELLPLYHKLGYAETGAKAFHPPPAREVGVECHLIILAKEIV